MGTLFALLLIGGNASGITIQLNAAKDNTLYEDVNGSLSNGAGPGLFAGVTLSGDRRRALIMFDVAAELPESASITAATLLLNVSAAANSVLADAIVLHRVSTDWGEADSVAVGGNGGGGAGGPALPGDATWLHSFSPNNAWTNVGGDYSDTVSASQSVAGNGSYTWSSPQLTNDLQDMFATPSANFGWIVLGNESFSQTAKRFDSRESFQPPILTIEYDLPPGLDADFDGDNDVDGDDLVDWKNAFGAGDGGDADNDSDTDGADFLVWQQQFTGPAGLQTAVVPEPATASLALALLALAALNSRSTAHRS